MNSSELVVAGMASTPASAAGSVVVKKRAEWIEIARVIATAIIVVRHVNYTTTFDFYDALFVGGRVPFFFFVAGFLTRPKNFQSGSWFNWRRAALLALPFFVWQLAMMFGALEHLFSFPDVSWETINWKKWIRYTVVLPLDGTLWFLRDLVFLSLISPLLVRLRSGLYFLAVATWVFDDTFGPQQFLLPCAWGFYFLGLGLNSYPVEWLRGQVKRTHWYSIGLLILLTAGIVFFEKPMRLNSAPILKVVLHGDYYSSVISIIGIVSLWRISIWIEDSVPYFSKRLGNLGISSFLVYAAHYPILLLLEQKLNALELNDPGKWGIWSYIYPVLILLVIYAGCHLFYLFLHRYLPWSLPFVAARRVPTKMA